MAGLPKYGFNRNTPLPVVYAGSDFTGIELRDLKIEKGISQLQHLIMALRTPGFTRSLSLIAISWMQLIAGTQQPVFSDVSTPLPHLYPMKWLPAVRNFLNNESITLEIEDISIPSIQRINDFFLMDFALSMKYTNIELQTLNAYRLYKGFTLASDVKTINGRKI